jgi:small acid-soluble spore protein F (minor alpha/beta-type SASP)
MKALTISGVNAVGDVMSDKVKSKLAHDLGFGEKIEDGDWGDVTTGEVGSMVREAIRRGEQAMAE